MEIIYLIQGILLLGSSIQDIREKKVSIFYIISMAAAGIAGCIVNSDKNLLSVAGGVCIGFCAVGISMISKKQMGIGDGLIIMTLGLSLGARNCLIVVCMACFCMAVLSIGVLLLKKGNRHTQLPFLPALLTGYGGYMLCRMGYVS